MTTLYRTLYEPVVDALVARGPVFHGSTVRALFIERASGRFAVDDHAGKLLLELCAAGEIARLELAPTVSQRAFAGLQISGKAYRAQELGTWNAEHHYWRWVEKALGELGGGVMGVSRPQ